MKKSSLLMIAAVFFTATTKAQRDTTKPQSINITSSFKPVLRNAVKINFSGTQLTADTNHPVRTYNIPSQNLFYAYQPIALKPLALQQDSNLYPGGRNFLKAGFGSFTTPYVRAGLSFGDGRKSLVNLYAGYIGSQGNIKNQDYSLLDIKATGSYFLPKHEVYGLLEFYRDEYFLYGYDHNAFDFKKEDIRNRFQDITVGAGMRNTAANDLRISYDPNVKVNFFTNTHKLSETTVTVDLPVEKKSGDDFVFKLALHADITNYATKDFPDNINLTNNLVQLLPSIVYSSSRFTINAGITPVWNNGKFEYLPNIFAEGQLKEKVFLLQAGWVGRMTQNSYRNLSAINPYLSTIRFQTNTKEVELYGGIKASIGKHFNFNAKAGLVTYHDLPLFINDYSNGNDGKNFIVSNETKIDNFRIRGDVSFISQDKFTFTAGLTLNGYTGLKDNTRAWNTLPMEFTSSLRWWAFEHLLLKGDFYVFGGGKYRDALNESRAFSGGSDLSAGAEYKINKQFSAFLDVNNIFGNKYERWHNYEVYGLNLLGGIIIHF